MEKVYTIEESELKFYFVNNELFDENGVQLNCAYIHKGDDSITLVPSSDEPKNNESDLTWDVFVVS